MKRCPYCVEQMQDVAIVCPHCGRDFPLSESEDRFTIVDSVKPGKSVHRIFTGVIILSLVFFGWALWFAISRGQTAAGQSTQSQVATLQSNYSQLLLENDKLAASVTELQAKPVQSSAESASLALQATAQAARITDLESQVALYQSQAQRFCQGYGEIKFDFTNNETLFAQLKDYAKGVGGEITKSSYVLPWNDPAIAIYTINTELDKKPYTFIFIGYFKSELMNLQNAIYWIGNDCYLERQ